VVPKGAGVINQKTIKILNLKPITKTMCYDFYIKINSEFDTPEAIKESISWWQDDIEKLNNLWWVLNYYSDRLDLNRSLRACIERALDNLAQEKAKASEESSYQSGGAQG
jgi:hypothetical protein